MTKRMTTANALAALTSVTEPFTTMFAHGSMELEVYKPDQVDHQQPHTRDELYIVISGSGTFVNGDDQHDFEAGEVLFVAAGVEHRFVDFTADFATWVIFYGPEGGENGLTP